MEQRREGKRALPESLLRLDTIVMNGQWLCAKKEEQVHQSAMSLHLIIAEQVRGSAISSRIILTAQGFYLALNEFRDGV
jgi:hypothetical protein